MKYLITLLLVLLSSMASAKVQFNVVVGTDFQSPFNDTFDSVYFQSVGDPVTIEKVVVHGKTGECELIAPMRSPMLFKWGHRFSTPIWDCKYDEVESVSIHTPKYIYTYRI